MKITKTLNSQTIKYAALALMTGLVAACGSKDPQPTISTVLNPTGNVNGFHTCLDPMRVVDQVVVGSLGGGAELRIALYSVPGGNSVEAAGVINFPALEDYGFSTNYAAATKTPFTACVRSQGPGQLGNGAIQDLDITLVGTNANVMIQIGWGMTYYGDQASIRGSFLEGSMSVTINGVRQDLIAASNR